MSQYKIPIIARGKVIEDCEITCKGRFGASFIVPDPHKYLPRLLLSSRSEMVELYTLSLDEIVDYLVELGQRLDIRTNPHLQWALELNNVFSYLPRPLAQSAYDSMRGDLEGSAGSLSRARLGATIATAGREHLDGWATTRRYDGRIVGIRAVGVPTVHVIAGNAPTIVVLTVLRNALVRSYAIVKIPSNELGAPVAVGRTMIDMAPDHPLTRAYSCAYWKGGDESFESKLYHPRHIDRIVAWGGESSVRHIARYLRPGLDLVTFDPKISRAILGPEALEEENIDEVAVRLAADIGYLNQEGCASCRLVFVKCPPGEESLGRLKKLSHRIFDEIQRLPAEISCEAPRMDPELEAKIKALDMLEDDYYVVGGDKRGGVIVSLIGELVDFSTELAHRTVNVVPIPDYDVALRLITRDVQSVGVYPESLRDELRLPLALHGVQRITSLGYMLFYDSQTTTHDGNEGLRRMATWVVSEDCMTNQVPALWRKEAGRQAGRES